MRDNLSSLRIVQVIYGQFLSKYSVPLFEKEGLGEILLHKSPSIPLCQRGEYLPNQLAIESKNCFSNASRSRFLSPIRFAGDPI